MQIFIARNNEQRGPYSLDVVQAALNAGKLNNADLAWYEGAPGWVPLSQIPGIRVLQSSIPPPLPPVQPPPLPAVEPPFSWNQNAQSQIQSTAKVGFWAALGAVCLSFLLDFLLLGLLGDGAIFIFAIMGPVSTWWVFSDTRKIGVKKGQMSGIFDMDPLSWGVACFLFWGIVFPVYLVARPQYIRINS